METQLYDPGPRVRLARRSGTSTCTTDLPRGILRQYNRGVGTVGTALRKLRTLAGLPAGQRRVALAALALTGGMRIALWTMPFRVVKRLAEGRFLPRLFRRRRSEEQVIWAVRLAARSVPGATCLPRALAGQVLLAGAGLESHLHIGVARGERFEAHAWVERDGRVVIGGEESLKYRTILTFEGRRAAPSGGPE